MRADSTPVTVGAIALLGSSDLPGLGDQLFPRILERELAARLPGWRIARYAPLGWTRPAVTDGGVVAEPLGEFSPARVARIAEATHLTVLCPTFPLGADLAGVYGSENAAAAQKFFDQDELSAGVRVDSSRPAVAVRDSRSRERLGVDVPVVPNLCVLAGSLCDGPTLVARERQLRQLGELPPSGGFVVVHVTPDVDFGRLKNAVGDRVVVALPTGGVSGDLGEWVLPADVVLEDRLAVLAAADVVIATDEHVAAAAAALGTPFVLFDPSGEERWPVLEFASEHQIVSDPDGLLEFAASVDISAAAKAVHAHLDTLAEAAEQALVVRGGDVRRRMSDLEAENRALRVAHARLRQRLLHERQVLIESAVVDSHLGDELEHERLLHRELAERHRALAEQCADVTRELEALRQTKLLRWSRPLRETYGKIKSQ